jgi:hypothetical protein
VDSLTWKQELDILHKSFLLCSLPIAQVSCSTCVATMTLEDDDDDDDDDDEEEMTLKFSKLL